MAGIAHLELGDTARARQLLEQAERDHARLIPAVTPDRVDLWVGLTRLYLRVGELDKARDYARRADEFWKAHDPTSRWAGEAAYWHGQSLAGEWFEAGEHRAAASGRAHPCELAICVRSTFDTRQVLSKLRAPDRIRNSLAADDMAASPKSTMNDNHA